MAESIKITILKSDEPAAVAEKLMDTDAEEIILSIPKFSKFAESVANFKLIKKQAELLKRSLRIESVDEDAVALAKKAGLDAVNPFFGRALKGQRQFSDIVAKKPVKISRATSRSASTKKSASSIAVNNDPEPELESKEDAEEPAQEPKSEVATPSPVRITGLGSIGDLPVQKKIANKIFRVKTLVLLSLAILLFGVVPYVALAVLPKADVTLNMQKEDWLFKNAVIADKAITEIDNAASRIPGQVFIQKTNITSRFAANGKKNIEKKATGSVTLYNAYNSESQTLVANTRIMSPDGKIFRLVSAVTIPGAKIENGKIAPSSITAEVIADKPGEAYNIGPTEKFTIPGFSGTPRYEGFYASSKTAFSGGFIGEARVATDADIAAAKQKAAESLETSLRTLLAAQMPSDFTALNDASVFAVTKQTVTPEADAEGQFVVLSEGQISLIAFREKDLLDFLRARVMAEKGRDFEIIGETKEYGVARVDLNAGRVSFALTYNAQLRRSLDTVGFLSQIIGKSESDLKTIIAGVPGISGGTAKLWPFYVRKVTKDTGRVKVVVE